MATGDRWDRVYDIPAGTDYADAIRGVIADRFPGTVCKFDATGFVTPNLRLGTTPGSSPWQDAEDMANAIGYELAFDDDGAVCTLTKAGALDRSPRKNWVERHGGLPSYVERIAKHLLAKGFPMSRAIATAISTTKRWCATGEIHQWPGVQRINLGSRAEACKAAAEWEALKARARAAKKTDDTELDDNALAELIAAQLDWGEPGPATVHVPIVKTEVAEDGSLIVYGRLPSR